MVKICPDNLTKYKHPINKSTLWDTAEKGQTVSWGFTRLRFWKFNQISNFKRFIPKIPSICFSDSDAEELPEPATPPLRMRLFCADEEKRKLLCNMFGATSSEVDTKGPSSPNGSPKKRKKESKSFWIFNWQLFKTFLKRILFLEWSNVRKHHTFSAKKNLEPNLHYFLHVTFRNLLAQTQKKLAKGSFDAN